MWILRIFIHEIISIIGHYIYFVYFLLAFIRWIDWGNNGHNSCQSAWNSETQGPWKCRRFCTNSNSSSSTRLPYIWFRLTNRIWTYRSWVILSLTPGNPLKTTLPFSMQFPRYRGYMPCQIICRFCEIVCMTIFAVDMIYDAWHIICILLLLNHQKTFHFYNLAQSRGSIYFFFVCFFWLFLFYIKKISEISLLR